MDLFTNRHPKHDPFTTAYLECAIWSSTEGGEPMDVHYSIQDIAPEALEKMRQDCHKFQEENADDILSDLKRAGHDFWLTRNGHGAGFWDGDWPDEVGKRLTEASKRFGECSLYVGDDNLIYLYPG